MSQAYAGTAAVVAHLPSNMSFNAAELDLLQTFCTQTNDYIEQFVWRPIGPTSGGTATFDGAEDVSWDGRSLTVRQGIRTITSIEVAPSTGSTAVAGTVADFVILPRTQNRKPDWPGFEVRIKDTVTGAVSTFGHGYGDIVIVGDFGWAAIPESIKEVAEINVVRRWHARLNGQADVVGSDANGEPIVSRFISAKDRRLLQSFRPAGGLVAG